MYFFVTYFFLLITFYNGKINKVVLVYSICMPLFKPRGNVKKKPGSKRKAVGLTIGGLAVAAALSFVGRSMEKSKVEQLARTGDLKAKTTLVSKASTMSTFKTAYPQVTEAQILKEQNEIRKLLRLNLTNEVDKRVESTILRIAKKAGVSPRVTVRTLARSGGESSALEIPINSLKAELKLSQSRGDLKRAKYQFAELEKKQKIQLILKGFEEMSEASRTEFRGRISGY